MSTPEHKAPLNPQLQQWLDVTPGALRAVDTRYLPKSVFSLPKPIAACLARVLSINALMPVHKGLPDITTAQAFSQATLDNLGIKLEVDEAFDEQIPKEGPLVIVANHPFGGIDGVALMARLLRVRPDTKLLINLVLGIFPDLRQACLPLDILSSTAEARSLNMASLRIAAGHLHHGGAVMFFPSGTVSHWQFRKGVTDPEWQTTPARFAMRHNAPMLPIYFHGSNSLFFNMAGVIHPMMRTLLLPHEMAGRMGKSIKITVGRTVDPVTYRFLGTPETVTAYLRMRCYALADAGVHTTCEIARTMEPLAEPCSPLAVAEAIAALPEECFMLRDGDYAIYCLKSDQSPLIMDELGAVREHTFRLAGEGSGKARDLDEFDERHYHIILWHEKDQKIVGAYRMGKISEILASHGPDGLYTSSLFSMNKEFFRRYEHSLELGRAVVHPLYQREYAPLMLLWKGIGQFLLRHEDIRCLFGPVSLSLDYATPSLRTAIEYFKEQCGSPHLATMVKGRYFPKRLFKKNKDFPLPDTLNYNGLVALVRDIEGGRGIPILFKHYLKLGGKIGAFHIDTAFNTMDAFLLMDLSQSPRFMLERYMTKQGATQFLSRFQGEIPPHGQPGEAPHADDDHA